MDEEVGIEERRFTPGSLWIPIPISISEEERNSSEVRPGTEQWSREKPIVTRLSITSLAVSATFSKDSLRSIHILNTEDIGS